MLKLLAITMPHITEEIYQDYFRKFEKTESIHLTTLSPISIDKEDKIIENGDMVVDIVSKVRQFKSENKLSLKTEIEDVTIQYGASGLQIDSLPATRLKHLPATFQL